MDKFTIEELKIGRITFVKEKYDKDVIIKFTEEQEDRWYSDREIETYIDKEDAQGILDFLVKHFPDIRVNDCKPLFDHADDY